MQKLSREMVQGYWSYTTVTWSLVSFWDYCRSWRSSKKLILELQSQWATYHRKMRDAIDYTHCSAIMSAAKVLRNTQWAFIRVSVITGPTHAKLVSWPHRCVAADHDQWIHSRPRTGRWIQGWAMKDFSDLNVMHGISKYTLNGIFLMILNFRRPTIVMKPKNVLLLFISIWKM